MIKNLSKEIKFSPKSVQLDQGFSTSAPVTYFPLGWGRRGAVPRVKGCWIASLVSTHWMPVVPPHYGNLTGLLTMVSVPWGQSHPWLKTACMAGMLTQDVWSGNWSESAGHHFIWLLPPAPERRRQRNTFCPKGQIFNKATFVTNGNSPQALHWFTRG